MIPIDSALHGDVIIYQSGQENISTNVLFKDETFWMAQKDMATLFCVQVPAINKHLKNIFAEQELSEDSVISKMEITARDGKIYSTNFYNLDAIIAVGKYSLILTESYTNKTSNMMRGSKRLSNRLENA